MNWINLDYFSTTDTGALLGVTADLRRAKWGELSGYCYYALYFALAPYALALVLGGVWPFLDVYGKNLRRHKHTLMATLLLGLQLLYTPVTLAVFRLYYCNSEGALDCDRAVSCASVQYFTFVGVCTALVTPLFLGLPVLTYLLILPNIVYRQSRDHEKRMQATEIAYSLDLDDVWLAQQSWLCSSFHRKRVYSSVLLLALKAILLLLFVFARSSYVLQSSLMWLALALFATHCSVKWPFRCQSSNHCLHTLLALLVVVNTYYTMDAFGVVNSFMVSSSQFFGILTFFCLAALLLLLIALDCVLRRARNQWPSAMTLRGLQSEDATRPLLDKWVCVLREARDTRCACFMAADANIDIHGIEHCIRRLRKCWLAARSRGSLFEVILGDSLDALLRIHQVRYPSAYRKDDKWEREMREQAPVLAQRAQRTALLSKQARRVMLKVMAYRAFTPPRLQIEEAEEQEYPPLYDLLSYDADEEALGEQPGEQHNFRGFLSGKYRKSVLQAEEEQDADGDHLA